MTDSDNFFIHLNSNVSDIIVNTNCVEPHCELSRNTIGNFINRLSRRVTLKGEWEVALTNIQYRKSWLNIHEDQFLFLVGLDNQAIPLKEKFPAGNYVTPEEVVNKLNQIYSDYIIYEFQTIDPIDYPPIFEYNAFSNKMRIRLGERRVPDMRKRYLFPKVSKYLARYLGLSDIWDMQWPESNFHAFDDLPKTDLPNADPTLTTTLTDQPVLDNLKRSISHEEGTSKKVKRDSNQPSEPDSKAVIILDEEQVLTTQRNVSPSENERPEVDSDDNKAVSNRENDPKPKTSSSEVPPYDETPPKNNGWKKVPREYRNNNSDQIPNDESNSFSYTVPRKMRYVDGFGVVTLHGPIDTMYIYCSLIKPSLIANVEAPVIRRVAVPSEAKFGILCEADYLNKEYYPLLTNEFDKVEIDIQNDSGNTVDFKFGKTALTLHFRRKFNYGI